MALLIDASVFVAIERRRCDLDVLNLIVPDAQLAVSTITVGEILIGVHRADSLNRRHQRQGFVEAVLGRFPTVPFDVRAAESFASVGSQLAVAGTPIGSLDLLVAATALVHGDGVVTENVGEFRRVPGLVVLQPIWPITSEDS